MITIAMAVYNEEGTIEAVIDNLLEMKLRDYEILVVSDGSTDNTNHIINQIIKKEGVDKLKLIRIDRRHGKAHAVNMILKQARGDLIIFTDGDVFIQQDSIAYLLNQFKPGVGIVAGKPVFISNHNRIVSHFYYLTEKFWDEKRQANPNGYFISGNLYAIRKGIVNNIPGDIINEDSLMACLVKKAGYGVVYEPQATVKVNIPPRLIDYFRQKKRIQMGWVQLSDIFGRDINPTPIADTIKFIYKEAKQNPIMTMEFFIITSFATLCGILEYKIKNGEVDNKWKRLS